MRQGRRGNHNRYKVLKGHETIRDLIDHRRATFTSHYTRVCLSGDDRPVGCYRVDDDHLADVYRDRNGFYSIAFVFTVEDYAAYHETSPRGME